MKEVPDVLNQISILHWIPRLWASIATVRIDNLQLLVNEDCVCLYLFYILKEELISWTDRKKMFYITSYYKYQIPCENTNE